MKCEVLEAGDLWNDFSVIGPFEEVVAQLTVAVSDRVPVYEFMVFGEIYEFRFWDNGADLGCDGARLVRLFDVLPPFCLVKPGRALGDAAARHLLSLLYCAIGSRMAAFLERDPGYDVFAGFSGGMVFRSMPYWGRDVMSLAPGGSRVERRWQRVSVTEFRELRHAVGPSPLLWAGGEGDPVTELSITFQDPMVDEISVMWQVAEVPRSTVLGRFVSRLNQWWTTGWDFPVAAEAELANVWTDAFAEGDRLVLKSAPPISLLGRLTSALMACNSEAEFGGLWRAFLRKVRMAEEIPGVGVQGPDHRCCLIWQKLQLISAVKSARQVEFPQFLRSGEPAHAPEAVSCLLMTEDQADDWRRAIEQTLEGDDRAVVVSATLKFEMQQFSDANPSAEFEDFVSYFSRGDVTEAGLSKRMAAEGNIWRRLWDRAKKKEFAHESSPFRPDAVFESAMDYLECEEGPRALIGDLLPVAFEMVAQAVPAGRDIIERWRVRCEGRTGRWPIDEYARMAMETVVELEDARWAEEIRASLARKGVQRAKQPVLAHGAELEGIMQIVRKLGADLAAAPIRGMKWITVAGWRRVMVDCGDLGETELTASEAVNLDMVFGHAP